MALTKRLYKNHQTVITAENMNDIQDAILALEQMAGIVPGEGETTKIIDVINPAGTLSAAGAAALPDGLYWVKNPVTFQTADQSDSFTVSGLASKAGQTWCDYATCGIGTTDDSGVLQEWHGPDLGGDAIQSIAVSYTGDEIAIDFSMEDDLVTYRVALTDGLPTSINVGGEDIPVAVEGFEDV